MPDTSSQHFANHARYVPFYHFVLFPLLTFNLLLRGWWLYKNPSFATAWELVLAVALIMLQLFARTFALRAQDRLIRLEERMRLVRLLPAELQGRVEELRAGQLVALRFASDAELPDLVRRVLAGELTAPKAIKQNIRDWRPDHFRV